MKLTRKGRRIFNHGLYEVMENGADPFVVGAVAGITAGLFASPKNNKKGKGSRRK